MQSLFRCTGKSALTVGSWSFEGREGKPVQLEVYADAEEVELFLNGKSAGKAIITEKGRYKAAFELLWQPGTIEAVAYRSGTVCGRCALTSAAGAPSLSVEPECAEVSFRQRDVIFVPIRAAGENGQTLLQRKDTVSVCIDGRGRPRSLPLLQLPSGQGLHG